jgi:hypothetical protein
MPHTIDLATLLAQLPNAQHIHHAIQAHPEIFQALAQDLVRKKAARQKQRVAKAEPGQSSSATSGQRTTSGHLHRSTTPESSSLPEPFPDRGRILDTEV